MEREANRQNPEAEEDLTMPMVEPEKTEQELEQEREQKWNYGLEIYYRNRKYGNKQELFILYYNTPRT